MGNGHVGKYKSDAVSSYDEPAKLRPQWMKDLPGDKFIAEFSIPGTHETLALHGEPFFCTARLQCQSLTIYNQLLSGLRCFDLRIKNKGGKLYAYHHIVYQKQTFKETLESCYNFLEKYPSETILFKLKEEQANINVKSDFEKILWQEVKELEEKLYGDKQKDFWFTQNRVPQLEEIRGKIFLMRQYYGEIGFPYNQKLNRKLFYQVNWLMDPEDLKVMIKRFFKEIQNQHNISQVKEGNRLNLNLFNRQTSWFKGPIDYAKMINPIVFDESGYLGITLFDFPSSEVIEHVISQNFKQNSQDGQKSSIQPSTSEHQRLLEDL